MERHSQQTDSAGAIAAARHITVNAGDALYPQLARLVLAEAGDQRPSGIDLSQDLIVIPNDFLAAPLRHALQAACQPGVLLLPQIQTWQQLSQPFNDISPLPSHQRSLILAQALKRHRYLYGSGSRWGLASNLLQLFDELTLEEHTPQATLEDFKQALAAQLKGQEHYWFNREAKLVYTLWQAWHEQMQAEGWLDAPSAYVSGLVQHAQLTRGQYRQVFVLLPPRLYRCEQRWLEQVAQHCQLIKLDYQPANHDTLNTLLQQSWQPGNAPAPQADLLPSPLRDKLATAPCASAEAQATAVAIAVRQHLQAQPEASIAVISEDRRLARRLRALLERMQVSVDDKSGWTLSTTRAGACLEHWLQCIETDFAYQPLLDLLKSPFSLPQLSDKAQLCYRLEQDLIHHENIASGLANYRRALDSRSRRLQLFSPEQLAASRALLDLLEQAAAPLTALQQGGQHQVAQYTTALQQSLALLGLRDSLGDDPAGQQLLRLLDELQAQNLCDEELDWSDFRSWVGQALESGFFRPSARQAHITLLNYSQAAWFDADYRILCGAEAGHLPPAPPKSPFFNQATRQQLGLDTRERHNARFRQILQRLLLAPGQLLVSWQNEQDGEPIALAGWLEAILRHHQQRFPADPLEASALLETVRSTLAEKHALPHYTQPAPVAVELLPHKLSVGAHQRLVNCPYQHFASDLLALSPLDEIREALEKSDYGSRVHLALEAFHRDVPGLPGPFPNALHTGLREQAIALLGDISRAVFLKDMENNFQHRSWLKRWQAVVPFYIDWEIERQQSWQPQQMEVKVEYAVSPELQLRGRIDRIDSDKDEPEKRALIDYKTGATASASDIAAGEDVQLSSYAFTLEHVSRISYVSVGDAKRISNSNGLEGEDLQTLALAVHKRLQDLHARIAAGEGLPAWGEQAVCDRCNNAGICRRHLWSE